MEQNEKINLGADIARQQEQARTQAESWRRGLLDPAKREAVQASVKKLEAQSESIRALKAREQKELAQAAAKEQTRLEQEKQNALKQKQEAAEKAMQDGEKQQEVAKEHKEECDHALTVTKQHEDVAKNEEAVAKAGLQNAMGQEHAAAGAVQEARGGLSAAQNSLSYARGNLAAAQSRYASAPEDQKALYAGQIAHFSRYVEGGIRRVANQQQRLRMAEARLVEARRSVREKQLVFTNKAQIHKMRQADRLKAENNKKAAEIKLQQMMAAFQKLKAFFEQQKQQTQTQDRVVKTVDQKLKEVDVALAAASEMYARGEMLACQAEQAHSIALVAVETTSRRIEQREKTMKDNAHKLLLSKNPQQDMSALLYQADGQAFQIAQQNLQTTMPGVDLQKTQQHIDLQDLQNRSIYQVVSHGERAAPFFVVGKDAKGAPIYAVIDTNTAMSPDGKLPMRQVHIERSADGKQTVVQESNQSLLMVAPDQAQTAVYGSQEQRMVRAQLEMQLSAYNFDMGDNPQFKEFQAQMLDPLKTPPEKLGELLQKYPPERLALVMRNIQLESRLPQGEGYSTSSPDDRRIMEMKYDDLTKLMQTAQSGGLDPTVLQTLLKGRTPEDFKKHMSDLLATTQQLEGQIRGETDPVHRLQLMEELSKRRVEYAKGMQAVDKARGVVDTDIQENKRTSLFAKFVTFTGGGDWKELEGSAVNSVGEVNQLKTFRAAFLAPLKVIMDTADIVDDVRKDVTSVGSDFVGVDMAKRNFENMLANPHATMLQKFEARTKLEKAQSMAKDNKIIGFGRATSDVLGLLAMPVATIGMSEPEREKIWQEMEQSNMAAGGLEMAKKTLREKGLGGIMQEAFDNSVSNPLAISSFFASSSLQIGTGAVVAEMLMPLKTLQAGRLLEKSAEVAVKAEQLAVVNPVKARLLAAQATKMEAKAQQYLAEKAESLLSKQLREIDKAKLARRKGEKLSASQYELLGQEPLIQRQYGEARQTMFRAMERASTTSREYYLTPGSNLRTFARANYAVRDTMNKGFSLVGKGLVTGLRATYNQLPTFRKGAGAMKELFDKSLTALPGGSARHLRRSLDEFAPEDVQRLTQSVHGARDRMEQIFEAAQNPGEGHTFAEVFDAHRDELGGLVEMLESISSPQSTNLARTLRTVLDVPNPEQSTIMPLLQKSQKMLGRMSNILDVYTGAGMERAHPIYGALSPNQEQLIHDLETDPAHNVDTLLQDKEFIKRLQERGIYDDAVRLRDHYQSNQADRSMHFPLISPEEEQRLLRELKDMAPSNEEGLNIFDTNFIPPDHPDTLNFLPDLDDVTEVHEGRVLQRFTRGEIFDTSKALDPYNLPFEHGSSSASLIGVVREKGLIPSMAALKKQGTMPFSGELRMGISEGKKIGVNQRSVSIASTKSGMGNDYAFAMDFNRKPWSPAAEQAEIDNLKRMLTTEHQQSMGMHDEDVEYFISRLQNRIEIGQRRLEQFPHLTPLEQEFITDPFPMSYGVTVYDRHLGRSKIFNSEEAAVAGRLRLGAGKEIPAIFVPENKVDMVRSYLTLQGAGTDVTVLPFDYSLPYRKYLTEHQPHVTPRAGHNFAIHLDAEEQFTLDVLDLDQKAGTLGIRQIVNGEPVERYITRELFEDLQYLEHVQTPDAMKTWLYGAKRSGLHQVGEGYNIEKLMPLLDRAGHGSLTPEQLLAFPEEFGIRRKVELMAFPEAKRERRIQEAYQAYRDTYLNIEATEFADLHLDPPIYQVRYLGTGPERYPLDVHKLMTGERQAPIIVRKGGDEFVIFRREGNQVAAYFADMNNLGILNGYDSLKTDKILNNYMREIHTLMRDTSLQGEVLSQKLNETAKQIVINSTGQKDYDMLLSRARFRKLLQDTFDKEAGGKDAELFKVTPEKLEKAKEWMLEQGYLPPNKEIPEGWKRYAVAINELATNPATAHQYQNVNLGGMTMTRRFLDNSQQTIRNGLEVTDPRYLRRVVDSISDDIHAAKEGGLSFIDSTNHSLKELPTGGKPSIVDQHERDLNALFEKQARAAIALEDHEKMGTATLQMYTDLDELLTQSAQMIQLDPISGVRSEGDYMRSVMENRAAHLFSADILERSDVVSIKLDLKHMGALNNKIGYDAGDSVLRSTGDLLGGAFHEHYPPVYVYRTGGGEFRLVTAFETPQQKQKFLNELQNVLTEYNTKIPDTFSDEAAHSAVFQALAREYFKNPMSDSLPTPEMVRRDLGTLHMLEVTDVKKADVLDTGEGILTNSIFLKKDHMGEYDNYLFPEERFLEGVELDDFSYTERMGQLQKARREGALSPEAYKQHLQELQALEKHDVFKVFQIEREMRKVYQKAFETGDLSFEEVQKSFQDLLNINHLSRARASDLATAVDNIFTDRHSVQQFFAEHPLVSREVMITEQDSGLFIDGSLPENKAGIQELVQKQFGLQTEGDIHVLVGSRDIIFMPTTKEDALKIWAVSSSQKSNKLPHGFYATSSRMDCVSVHHIVNNRLIEGSNWQQIQRTNLHEMMHSHDFIRPNLNKEHFKDAFAIGEDYLSLQSELLANMTSFDLQSNTTLEQYLTRRIGSGKAYDFVNDKKNAVVGEYSQKELEQLAANKSTSMEVLTKKGIDTIALLYDRGWTMEDIHLYLSHVPLAEWPRMLDKPGQTLIRMKNNVRRARAVERKFPQEMFNTILENTEFMEGPPLPQRLPQGYADVRSLEHFEAAQRVLEGDYSDIASLRKAWEYGLLVDREAKQILGKNFSAEDLLKLQERFYNKDFMHEYRTSPMLRMEMERTHRLEPISQIVQGREQGNLLPEERAYFEANITSFLQYDKNAEPASLPLKTRLLLLAERDNKMQDVVEHLRGAIPPSDRELLMEVFNEMHRHFEPRAEEIMRYNAFVKEHGLQRTKDAFHDLVDNPELPYDGVHLDLSQIYILSSAKLRKDIIDMAHAIEVYGSAEAKAQMREFMGEKVMPNIMALSKSHLEEPYLQMQKVFTQELSKMPTDPFKDLPEIDPFAVYEPPKLVPSVAPVKPEADLSARELKEMEMLGMTDIDEYRAFKEDLNFDDDPSVDAYADEHEDKHYFDVSAPTKQGKEESTLSDRESREMDMLGITNIEEYRAFKAEGLDFDPSAEDYDFSAEDFEGFDMEDTL